MRTIVVVGASLAGLRATETLRLEGYAGRIVWIGAEPHLPYDRPPLSKEILRGDWSPARLELRRKGYDELELELELGRRAVSLDPAAARLELDDGRSVAYDGLVIATGSVPRWLPDVPDLSGIHALRTVDDALAIRAALGKRPRVAIVGAGFIGAEVAASCRTLGLAVTMIEALEVPMQRGLGLEVGAAGAAMHRDQGVDLRCGRRVEAFEGVGRIERLRLDDGARIEVDLVVIGVGIAPETGWLDSSGLELADGVLCDASCATAAPGIVVAGDVARAYNPLFDEAIRVEHWTNAVEQGVLAAQRLLRGADCGPPVPSVPTFWSDQYGVKIQFVGQRRADDSMRVVYGRLDERRFTVLYGRGGRLVAALGFDRRRQVMSYRSQIANRLPWEDALAQAAEAG